MICKHCGQQNDPENRFCVFCGKPIKGGRGWIPVLIVCLILTAAAAGIWAWRNHNGGAHAELPPGSAEESTGLAENSTSSSQDDKLIHEMPTLVPEPSALPQEPLVPVEPTDSPEPTVPPETTAPPETAAPPEPTQKQDEPVISGFDPAFWDQDFYGFVLFTNSTGNYSDGIGDYLMEVVLNEASDGGDFAMKGESCPADRANVIGSFYLTEGVTSRGSLVSTDIWLAGQENQQWQIDPGTGFSMNYADMICTGGHFEDENGSFDYSFFLRPWGTLWDDVAVQYPDLLPGRYEDWYLPLIETGQPMPEAFS